MANITIGQQGKNKDRLLDHSTRGNGKLRVSKKTIVRKCYSKRKVGEKSRSKSSKPKTKLLLPVTTTTTTEEELSKDANNNNTAKYGIVVEESFSSELWKGMIMQKKISDDVKTYERLMLSLQSPLPNEHALAINVCMKLSAEETKELNVIAREPALLNMLLAHIGFYKDCGLRMLMQETYKQALGNDFDSFWKDIVSYSKQYLLCECYPRSSCDNPEVEKGIVFEMDEKDAEIVKCCAGCRYFKREIGPFEDDTESLPKLYFPPCDRVGKRVHQVGLVLRNFSFERENAKVMANSRTMMRFLLASVHSDFGTLPRIGFDIISNISSFTELNQGDIALDKLIQEMFELLKATVMESNDRFKIYRSLESLQISMQVVENQEMLVNVMDLHFCKRVFDLLTLTLDKILVINCIECILAITEMGAASCRTIIKVHGSLEILVSYITATFDGCDYEDFKVTVLKKKEPQSEPCRIKDWLLQQQQVLNTTPKEAHQFTFTTIPEKSGYPVIVPLEPVTVHPIHKRHDAVQKFTAALAMANRIPNDKPVEHTINGYLKNLNRNGLSGTPISTRQLIPDCADSSVNNHFERTSKRLLSDEELDNVIPYLCEWGNCNLRFLEKKQLRWHVYQRHCPFNKLTERMYCRWRGKHSPPSMSCQLSHSIFSLMKHLDEHHYSDTALEATLHRRRNKIEISQAVPVVVVEAEVLNQVHVKQVFETSATPIETIPENEDDVTKSIRLTAALVLRNLAKDSLDARRSLKRYESHFMEVAMRGLECSGAVSHLLYYLNE